MTLYGKILLWCVPGLLIMVYYLCRKSVLLLLLLKEVGSASIRESDIHPISLKTPDPQYQPIDRKKRKGKIVEDYSRDSIVIVIVIVIAARQAV